MADAAAHFPNLQPQSLDTAALEPRDARLALAIQRGALQRWLSIEHLLNRFLKKPLAQLEPRMQGVLLTAGAQILFMDRLPAHSIVDESVKLAKRMVRPGAAGMTNAVLRKLSGIADTPVLDKPWSPSADRLPIDGGFIPLADKLLPKPANHSEHLRVATSHPTPLIHRWLKRFGHHTTMEICHHGVMTPPVIVAVEPQFDATDNEYATPHTRDHFVVWDGPRESLVSFLAEHAARRVQDPASSEPVQAVASLQPRTILDYCAGRGTKTKQLAATFSNASVIATDTDHNRFHDLESTFASNDQVTIIQPNKLFEQYDPSAFDFILLDVPCSNTGVLARRPEARYRLSGESLRSLQQIQRQIITDVLPLLAPKGHLLYSTCSLEAEENGEQHAWMIEQFDLTMTDIARHITPCGHGVQYHDGGEFALLQRKC